MIGLRHSCFKVALLCAALGATTADAATIEGKVVGVSDGDTLNVLVLLSAGQVGDIA